MTEGRVTSSIQFYPPFTFSYIVEFISGILLITSSSELGRALKYICELPAPRGPDTPSLRMLPTVASEFLAHGNWAYFFVLNKFLQAFSWCIDTGCADAQKHSDTNILWRNLIIIQLYATRNTLAFTAATVIRFILGKGLTWGTSLLNQFFTKYVRQEAVCPISDS